MVGYLVAGKKSSLLKLNCVLYCSQGQHLSPCWLCPPLSTPNHNVFYPSFELQCFFKLSSIGWIQFLYHALWLFRSSIDLCSLLGSKFSQTHGPRQQKCPPLLEKSSIWAERPFLAKVDRPPRYPAKFLSREEDDDVRDIGRHNFCSVLL